MIIIIIILPTHTMFEVQSMCALKNNIALLLKFSSTFHSILYKKEEK